MRRLVFLVEGDTEIIFVEKHVIPYFYSKGYKNPMNAQKIITNRKLHKKGGNVNYAYLKNDIGRILAQGNVVVTTFVDFFRLPTTFPGYTLDVNHIDEIQNQVYIDLGENEAVIPYIQKHEMEALMFSKIDGFEFVVDDEKQLAKLMDVIHQYPNPEDINSTPQGAPSKRLDDIFGYDKVVDGELILEALGIDIMIEKCPRFAEWIGKIEKMLDY